MSRSGKLERSYDEVRLVLTSMVFVLFSIQLISVVFISFLFSFFVKFDFTVPFGGHSAMHFTFSLQDKVINRILTSLFLSHFKSVAILDFFVRLG